MSKRIDAERKWIIEAALKANDLFRLDDRYWYLDGKNGCWSAAHLRVLADEIDRRNAIEAEREKEYLRALDSAEGATS